jgi:hypothetical protein
MADDPDYLTAPECPYTGDLLLLLSNFGQKEAKISGNSPILANSGGKWGNLEAEANDLYAQLKAFSAEIRQGDVSERMSYFRTATALLEKIVSINERAVGLKQINEFQEIILNVFDKHLPPEIRTTIMDQLRRGLDQDAGATTEVSTDV